MFNTTETREALKSKSGIYKITLRGTNRNYVGQAKDLHKRMRSHINNAHCHYAKKQKNKFGYALEKYGPQAFDYSVLVFCDPGNLNRLEAYFIALFCCCSKDGFNVQEDSSNEYQPTSDWISREKIRRANTGKKRSPETIERMRESALRKPKRTSEASKKQSDSLKTWYKTPEGIEWKKGMKENLRNQMTGKKLPQHWRDSLAKAAAKRAKPVEQFDKSGNLIATFPSVSEASKSTGNGVGNLVTHLKGRLKTCGGHVWKYAPMQTC